MALFEFQLKPLAEVMPWGDAPDLYLSWFGLTDGIYYMNVGEEQLFRSTAEILAYWKTEYPSLDTNQPFVDYQVVRFYEDVLEILADVLQPVPIEMQSYISSIFVQKQWEQRLSNVADSITDEEIDDIYYPAIEWWGCRRLSTIHLNQGSKIWFWRTADTMHIRWDNRLSEIDGISVWTAKLGEFQLPVEEFIQEVSSFHHRLMDAMEERIKIIVTENLLPHVKIDFQNLLREQEDRTQWLTSALKRTPCVQEWSTVIDANRKLLYLNS